MQKLEKSWLIFEGWVGGLKTHPCVHVLTPTTHTMEKNVSWVAAVACGDLEPTAEGVVEELKRRYGQCARPETSREIWTVFKDCVDCVPQGIERSEYLKGFFQQVVLATPPEMGLNECWSKWGKFQTYLMWSEDLEFDWILATTRIFVKDPTIIRPEKGKRPHALSS